MRQFRIRIHPRYDKHRMASFFGPTDERVFLAQIEDIILVDPRWHDNQRRFHHIVGGGVELEEFHEVVPKDDFAGGSGDINTNLKDARVNHLDLYLPVAFPQVLEEVFST